MAIRGFDGWLGRLAAASLAVLLALGGLPPARVQAAEPTMLTASAPASVIYGSNVTVSASVSPAGATGTVDFTFDGTPATEPLSGGSAAHTFTPPGAGTFSYSATYSGDDTYEPSSGSGSVIVTKASITVIAEPKSKVYGDADPALTCQVSPTPGDTVTCSLARQAGEDVGSYAITDAGVAISNPDNYTLTFVPGTLTITKAPLVVTPANQTKTVGQLFTAFTGTVTGVRPGDVITATYASPGAAAAAPVGVYTITATPLVQSGSLGNYDPTLNTGTLTVIAAASAITTVVLVSSLNPAPPRQVVTLTALVSGLTSAQGTIRLQASPDGATWSDVAGPVAVTSIGTSFGATLPVTMPATAQTIRYRAVFASADPALGGSTGPELVQVVAKAAATVTLSAAPEAWEASIPVVVRATVAATTSGVTVRAGGTMDISIDDGPTSTVPVVDGVAVLPTTTLAEGSHTVTATYSGDDAFLGGATASLTRIVAANVVNASRVGVSGTSIYPVRDGWWDTVAIRGTRNERLGVTIRIYSPAGKLLTTRRIAAGSGPYTSTWNGRTAAGIILPTGRYRILQTLVDPSTTPALSKTWTSSVALSPRRMTWKTATFTVAPGPRNYRFSSGQGVGASSTSSAGALVLAGTDGGWPAVGYEFRLPEASTYREIRFQVLGSATGPAPTLGLQRWSSGAGWGQVYRADFGRTAVTPSTTAWRGLSSKSPAPFVTATRRVRGYVDGGGRLTGPFRFGLTGVRLVVIYGILTRS